MTGSPPPRPGPGGHPGSGDRGAAAECHDEVCITCSDMAVPVRVVRLLADSLAVVETTAGPEVVSVALVDAEPGDVVLVHAKEAIAVQEKPS